MSARDIFNRAAQGVLAGLGEDSFLRGTVPCKVNIEHGVQMTGYEDGLIVEKSVATIDKTLAPKRGDTLTHPDGNYVIDGVMTLSGFTGRYILREA